MKKAICSVLLAASLAIGSVPAYAQTQQPNIKTRLDHLSGTPIVIVINYLPYEIVSVTCKSWIMLGIKSWKDHNDFTIPAGPAIAAMDASKFDGYCAEPNSIVAHTDYGDFVGHLDGGDGNWNASTKLTFIKP